MDNFDWKKLVQGIAPVLGSALLGPLAGTAIAQLGAAILGNPDASEAEVSAALTSGRLTGEQIVAMKSADQAFETRMRELDIDLVKINQASDEAMLKDVQDARARQVSMGDRMPQIIFFLMLGAELALMALFIYGKMPVDEFTRALITTAFGAVNSGFVGAVAYFIGSSRGSKQSGDAVRKIAEQAAK